MCNFIKKGFIKLLLLLVITACESNQHPVPRCVPADVFTETRTASVSAYFDSRSEDFIADNKSLGNIVKNDQVVRWKYTGYVTDGRPIVLKAEGMWTAWVNDVSAEKSVSFGDEDSEHYNQILSVERICGPYNKIEKTFVPDGHSECKVSCELITGVKDDLERGAYGPPCWFKNGYGAYLLFKRPDDPEPNETLDHMRYPVSPVMHIGYKPLELAGSDVFSTKNKPIMNSLCQKVQLEPGWKIYVKILDKYYYDNVGGYAITFLEGVKTEKQFSVFEWVRKQVRGELDKAGEQVFRHLVGNPIFKNFIFSVLTLFLVFGALAYIFGMVQSPFGDIIIRILKISLVILLISPSSWEFFYNHLLALFIHGIDQIIALINSHTGSYNPKEPFSFLDDMIVNKIFSPVIWKIKIRALIIADFSSIFAVCVIIIAVFIYIALCMYGCVIYLTAFVGITFLIGLFPLFLLGILFSQFKSLFDGWLTQCVSFAMQAILMFTLISLFGALIMNYYYRIFGFTTCYNEWLKVKICVLGKIGCIVDQSIFGWTPGQTYDPKVIGLTTDFNLNDRKSSGSARYKFTGGGAYIDVPPDRKHKDFRYVDYPFLDPDAKTDGNPFGVTVSQDSPFRQLSYYINALLSSNKKYVAARLVKDIEDELDVLEKNGTISLNSKNKVLQIIQQRRTKDNSEKKSELEKYKDEDFKSQIIDSIIADVIGSAAQERTPQEELNKQYDYWLILRVRAGYLIFWTEVGSLLLAALLIWQMRAFVQSVAVSLAGGNMMSQTIASMYEGGFMKIFSGIPVVGVVFQKIDQGIDGLKFAVGNYITAVARMPLNALKSIPYLGAAVKFTAGVTGALTSSYNEYDRSFSNNFKRLNYARAFIGAHLGFSPLDALKYLGGHVAGKMLGNRDGGLIHNAIEDRKAALDSLKAHILGPEKHRPSPYIPNKKKETEDDDARNPFSKETVGNKSGTVSPDEYKGGDKNHIIREGLRSEAGSALSDDYKDGDKSHIIREGLRSEAGSALSDDYKDGDKSHIIREGLRSEAGSALLDGYKGGNGSDIIKGGLPTEGSTLLDRYGNVCVSEGNIEHALEVREQLKTMLDNAENDTALQTIQYDCDRLDNALHEYLGDKFDDVTQGYASSRDPMGHPQDLITEDLSKISASSDFRDLNAIDLGTQVQVGSDIGSDVLQQGSADGNRSEVEVSMDISKRDALLEQMELKGMEAASGTEAQLYDSAELSTPLDVTSSINNVSSEVSQQDLASNGEIEVSLDKDLELKNLDVVSGDIPDVEVTSSSDDVTQIYDSAQDRDSCLDIISSADDASSEVSQQDLASNGEIEVSLDKDLELKNLDVVSGDIPDVEVTSSSDDVTQVYDSTEDRDSCLDIVSSADDTSSEISQQDLEGNDGYEIDKDMGSSNESMLDEIPGGFADVIQDCSDASLSTPLGMSARDDTDATDTVEDPKENVLPQDVDLEDLDTTHSTNDIADFSGESSLFDATSESDSAAFVGEQSIDFSTEEGSDLPSEVVAQHDVDSQDSSVSVSDMAVADMEQGTEDSKYTDVDGLSDSVLDLGYLEGNVDNPDIEPEHDMSQQYSTETEELSDMLSDDVIEPEGVSETDTQVDSEESQDDSGTAGQVEDERVHDEVPYDTQDSTSGDKGDIAEHDDKDGVVEHEDTVDQSIDDTHEEEGKFTEGIVSESVTEPEGVSETDTQVDSEESQGDSSASDQVEDERVHDEVPYDTQDSTSGDKGDIVEHEDKDSVVEHEGTVDQSIDDTHEEEGKFTEGIVSESVTEPEGVSETDTQVDSEESQGDSSASGQVEDERVHDEVPYDTQDSTSGDKDDIVEHEDTVDQSIDDTHEEEGKFTEGIVSESVAEPEGVSETDTQVDSEESQGDSSASGQVEDERVHDEVPYDSQDDTQDSTSEDEGDVVEHGDKGDIVAHEDKDSVVEHEGTVDQSIDDTHEEEGKFTEGIVSESVTEPEEVSEADTQVDSEESQGDSSASDQVEDERVHDEVPYDIQDSTSGDKGDIAEHGDKDDIVEHEDTVDQSIDDTHEEEGKFTEGIVSESVTEPEEVSEADTQVDSEESQGDSSASDQVEDERVHDEVPYDIQDSTSGDKGDIAEHGDKDDIVEHEDTVDQSIDDTHEEEGKFTEGIVSESVTEPEEVSEADTQVDSEESQGDSSASDQVEDDKVHDEVPYDSQDDVEHGDKGDIVAHEDKDSVVEHEGTVDQSIDDTHEEEGKFTEGIVSESVAEPEGVSDVDTQVDSEESQGDSSASDQVEDDKVHDEVPYDSQDDTQDSTSEDEGDVVEHGDKGDIVEHEGTVDQSIDDTHEEEGKFTEGIVSESVAEPEEVSEADTQVDSEESQGDSSASDQVEDERVHDEVPYDAQDSTSGDKGDIAEHGDKDDIVEHDDKGGVVEHEDTVDQSIDDTHEEEGKFTEGIVSESVTEPEGVSETDTQVDSEESQGDSSASDQVEDERVHDEVPYDSQDDTQDSASEDEGDVVEHGDKGDIVEHEDKDSVVEHEGTVDQSIDDTYEEEGKFTEGIVSESVTEPEEVSEADTQVNNEESQGDSSASDQVEDERVHDEVPYDAQDSTSGDKGDIAEHGDKDDIVEHDDKDDIVEHDDKDGVVEHEDTVDQSIDDTHEEEGKFTEGIVSESVTEPEEVSEADTQVDETLQDLEHEDLKEGADDISDSETDENSSGNSDSVSDVEGLASLASIGEESTITQNVKTQSVQSSAILSMKDRDGVLDNKGIPSDQLDVKDTEKKKKESSKSKVENSDKKAKSTKATVTPKSLKKTFKVILSQCTQELSNKLSEAFDKLFIDPQSGKQKRRLSKQDIALMIEQLKAMIESLKDRKAQVTDPDEMKAIEESIKQAESTIQNLLNQE
ncbi:trbL/VirB6 plasmid conjugal transfer family protein [Ehrlichia chaffeensis str. Heartland]|uniref:type IV secretion system protein n=1 Tax=Ehrlichia chaffeensis TaxID=945 RepID=UPI000444AA16|nr:type IV secretion system protein [Ehrlichia chaffeensis]AHX03595.1 trbL/VirB6 plasmid conjugal transfer family protein [Ehrlichia chaffeensis str. Heartland]AHX10028.1 trbL/VirB6 plasmid conjugal transfer family protein [Ehrlichia chaffeensis str. West Paces]